MSFNSLPRAKRALLAVSAALLVAATAFVSAGLAATSANPSATTPAAVTNGNDYNQAGTANCQYKLDAASGLVAGTLNGTPFSIVVTTDSTNKTSTFTAIGVTVGQAVVKSGTSANIFTYAAPGAVMDTVYGTAKTVSTGGNGAGNGLDASGMLLDPNDRLGISHICFNNLLSSGVAAAHLRSLTARASAGALNVRWQTASEVEVAGFNVWGVVGGHRTKLNARIIAGKGANGHHYAFTYHVPHGKQAPSRVLLQVVNLDGSRQWSGVRVAS